MKEITRMVLDFVSDLLAFVLALIGL